MHIEYIKNLLLTFEKDIYLHRVFCAFNFILYNNYTILKMFDRFINNNKHMRQL